MLKLKEIREAKGVKAKEIADYLNISAGTMSHYENGRTEMDHQSLCKTAEFLGVSVDALLGVADADINSKNDHIESVKKEEKASFDDEELEKQIKMLRSILGVMSREDRKKVLHYATSLFQDMI